MKKPAALPFYRSCVGWPTADVNCEGGLCDLVSDAIPISRRTFLANVDQPDLRALEAELGYEQHPRRGLTMAADWAVSYHRGQLHGQPAYYFRHSAIEYVFTTLPRRSAPRQQHSETQTKHSE